MREQGSKGAREQGSEGAREQGSKGWRALHELLDKTIRKVTGAIGAAPSGCPIRIAMHSSE